MNEVAIIFGRFNPPHKGHAYAWKLAAESPIWYIGTNQNTIGKDDPLPFAIKKRVIEDLWPATRGHLVAESNWLSMVHSVFEKHGDCVLKLVTDEDWVPKLVNRYNGVAGRHGNYKFTKIETVVPPRLSSATSLRNAVKSGDRAAFANAAGVRSDFEVAGVPYFDLVAKYLLPYSEETMTEDNLNIEFHDQLNPVIFDNEGKMLSNVRHKLMEIADDFKASLGVPIESLRDITVSGSNAAYNYTPTSDIDLHLVVDIPRVDHDDLYRELFDAKKFQYNATHTYKIKGYDVELYVQNANDPHYSLGIYSVLNDEWTHRPVVSQKGYDPETTILKYEKLKMLILMAIRRRDGELAGRLRMIIKKYRAAGLREQGEFGPENLAFKGLRANGYIEKLYNFIAEIKDEQLSLEDVNESMNEVVFHPDYKQDEKIKHSSIKEPAREIDPESLLPGYGWEKLFDVNGYAIYLRNRDEGSWSSFYAFNPLTNCFDMRVTGSLDNRPNGMKVFHIEQLDGRKGSALKAHDFYHAILRKLPIMFITNGQSPGGLKVWHKLQQFNDLEVYGWNPKVEGHKVDLEGGYPEQVDLDPDDPSETHIANDGSRKFTPDELKVLSMYLVAHKKIKGVSESAPVDTLLQRFDSWPGGANKWIANKVSKLDRLVDALRKNAFAPEMKIFGEAATDNDEIPDDINIFVDTKNIQLDKANAKQALAELVKLADQFHGIFNAYVAINGKVLMLDPRKGFVQAPQLASRQMSAAGKTGVPITLFDRRFGSIAYAGLAEEAPGNPGLRFTEVLQKTQDEAASAFNELQRLVDELMG